MKFSKGEKIFLFFIFLFGAFVMLLLIVNNTLQQPQQIRFTPLPQRHWQIESIDTMKYSRDAARQDLTDPLFAKDATKQITNIAATGANYVAIDTPYDSEFLPVLKTWVKIARAHHLHVWFRGNWSGWEGWFDYPQIDEQTHLAKTKQFILSNSDLFQNGDIFTSCPECENGIQLKLGDHSAIVAYRQFLINEYTVSKDAFSQIGKKVASNYFSMNADAARALMDKETTQKLDGIVVIDHYVRTPEQLSSDVAAIAQQSGGSIVLGEFGAPIPDIHGNMTEEQQKEWLQKSLQLLSETNSLLGVNYWVDKGGSTALWRDDGTPKPVVSVLKQYYQ